MKSPFAAVLNRSTLPILLVLVACFTVALIFPLRAHAAPVVGFNPGRIIDDAVFTNKSSMTPAQIQSFLNSKVPVCDTFGTAISEFGGGTRAQWAAARGYSPPFTCLKDFSEGGKTAAQIIYDAAHEFSINPQVLIVLLQKEQSLITDTWPIPGSSQYRTATGYGCPDTAACDSQYFGLTNQVRWSARMFRAILNDSPTWYTPYILGNNYIQYNPNTSCGGTVVNIQNRTTQALYNYTPYQPNPGALAAGWGTAPCGAYGNRNFYLYFTDWFGPTTRNLVTTVGQGVYLVENGVKRAFPSEITFLSYSYRWSEVLSISNAEFNQIPDGSSMPYNTQARNGFLVTSQGGGVYVVDGGTKRPFPNEATFFSYGYRYSDALVISKAELDLIPEGAAMLYDTNRRNGFLVTSQGGGVYVVDGGTKRPFPNEITFFSYGYKYSDASVVSTAELSLVPDGVPMPYNTKARNGFLVTSQGGGVYVVDGGTKRPFPNEATFFSYGYTYSDALIISKGELGLIPEGVPMPPKS